MLRLIGFYDYTVILTYASLIAAVLGMFFSADGAVTAAVLCLMISGICDAFDGTVARSKKNRTAEEKAFGIQIDSLCDAVSFGVHPAVLCYHLGMDGIPGMVILCLFALCAVIRLGFFNVMEEQRQKTEGGCNKTYRGLPVTTISILLPVFYLTRSLLPAGLFLALLHVLMAVTAFLFVLDFSVKKLDVSKVFVKK
ncbi:MAG: CDP-alcohol phosphatidyltransferase family protein [Oscillospiraceae bacterium]|nr:CDP-alcohol phosphatidyltransferase family protein [Oscillospiraceae bacterium]